jgi:hypothetical protein
MTRGTKSIAGIGARSAVLGGTFTGSATGRRLAHRGADHFVHTAPTDLEGLT